MIIMCSSRKYPYSPHRRGGRCGGLMVSALDSGASGPGSSPGRGHCVVFLGKTLHSHSASLHPGVYMGTGKFNARGNPAMDQHPIQGGVEILSVASCYGNWEKLRPDGPLGLNTDFTIRTIAFASFGGLEFGWGEGLPGNSFPVVLVV